MADQLTKAQELAVVRPGGPILVSAAAGSGKTKVLVERLMRQILRTDVECNIDDFLIITFTKKAASELRSRIAREFAERLASQPDNVHLQKQQSRIYLAKISTIHAFCGDLIREFAYELNIPADFRMIEESEAATLKSQLLEELLEERYETIDEDPGFQHLTDGIGAGRNDRTIQQLVLDVFRTAQCRRYPERWFQDCRERLELAGKTGAEETIWGAYLLGSFHRSLEQDIENLNRALAVIDANPAVGKYRIDFLEQLEQVRKLAAIDSWDGMYEAAEAGFKLKNLSPIRNCEDPELQARLKLTREDITKRVRDWLKEFYADSARVLADLEQTAETLKALFDLTLEFSARYHKEKLRQHALDFNDLEHQAVRLLLEPDGTTPTPTARLISERFREILVDEYQDTNDVQDSIFRAISREGRNRFMVGDVKQSIYRFRLADPTIFLKKYNTYPAAETTEPDGRQKILLSHNFRSSPAILSAVNDVFAHCMSEEIGGLEYGADEALRPGLTDPEQICLPVELHCISTKQEEKDSETPEKHRTEAEFVADRIRGILDRPFVIHEKKGDRLVEPGDIAILLRSPKNCAAHYVSALARRGISSVTDTGESILDTAEVETLLCLLKVLDNVHRDVPLAGVLLSPILGVSGSDLSRAKNQSEDQGLYDAICALEDPGEPLRNAMEILQQLREKSRELPLHRLLEKIRRVTALDAVYGAMPNGRKRLRNLQQFRDLASQYSENGTRSLHQFLQYVERLREQGGIPALSQQADAVKIMSIHKSKGLEFPVVVLSDLSKEFNREDQKAAVAFHSTLGAGCKAYDRATNYRYSTIARSAILQQTEADDLSEELRILYVAMTRAKQLLIMTFCSNSVEKRLTGLAQRLNVGNSRQIAGRAKCLGDWVLQTAMLRTEAGELFAQAGKPDDTSVSDDPWVIRYHRAEPPEEETRAAEEAAEPFRLPEPEKIAESLRFRYPWEKAAGVPSKVTATQLKGRALDEEAADGSPAARRLPSLRRPLLLHEEKPLTPAQRGTAMHQAMQFLDFSQTDSLAQIRAQLAHMEEIRLLTPQQTRSVDPVKLLRVFEGPLGERIRGADRVVREFKFSILTDASLYDRNAAGEKMMLQGVTDCCLIRDGQISVVDFKTDRVPAGEEQEAAEKYAPQLEAYSMALTRIFGLPIREKLLYFFHTDTLVRL